MGQVRDSLGDTLKDFAPQFVYHERQDYRRRETENKVEQSQYDCVFEHSQEIQGTEKPLEIEQAYPWAGGDAFEDMIILESQGHAVQGQVFEYDELGEHR